MSSVRNWALVSATAALILFGPIIAFVVVIAAEIPVNVVRENSRSAAGLHVRRLWKYVGDSSCLDTFSRVSAPL
jgi:hypothetical protein